MQITRRGHALQHEGDRSGHATILPKIKQFRRLMARKNRTSSTCGITNYRRYGIPAAQVPVFCLNNAGSGEMAATYLDSFERVWASSLPFP